MKRQTQDSSSQNQSRTEKRRSRDFAEFWDEYLVRHQHPVNRWIHVVATLSSLTCFVLAATFLSWKFLIAGPILSYGIAWVGHLLEMNIPATFKNPLFAVLADYRMVWKMLSGQELNRSKTSGPSATLVAPPVFDAEPQSEKRKAA